jgi:hypothetical protein
VRNDQDDRSESARGRSAPEDAFEDLLDFLHYRLHVIDGAILGYNILDVKDYLSHVEK